jgi:hypothetical protein
MSLRKFNPLAAEHPAVGQECAACRRRLVAGDTTTIVSLGPGDDPEEQENARRGLAYTAVGALVHWACATGENPEASQ